MNTIRDYCKILVDLFTLTVMFDQISQELDTNTVL